MEYKYAVAAKIMLEYLRNRGHANSAMLKVNETNGRKPGRAGAPGWLHGERAVG